MLKEDHACKHWQVVGGAGHGGVLVRSGPALSDELCETRLATGAVVKEIARSVQVLLQSSPDESHMRGS